MNVSKVVEKVPSFTMRQGLEKIKIDYTEGTVMAPMHSREEPSYTKFLLLYENGKEESVYSDYVLPLREGHSVAVVWGTNFGRDIRIPLGIANFNTETCHTICSSGIGRFIPFDSYLLIPIYVLVLHFIFGVRFWWLSGLGGVAIWAATVIIEVGLMMIIDRRWLEHRVKPYLKSILRTRD